MTISPKMLITNLSRDGRLLAPNGRSSGINWVTRLTKLLLLLLLLQRTRWVRLTGENLRSETDGRHGADGSGEGSGRRSVGQIAGRVRGGGNERTTGRNFVQNAAGCRHAADARSHRRGDGGRGKTILLRGDVMFKY